MPPALEGLPGKGTFHSFMDWIVLTFRLDFVLFVVIGAVHW